MLLFDIPWLQIVQLLAFDDKSMFVLTHNLIERKKILKIKPYELIIEAVYTS